MRLTIKDRIQEDIMKSTYRYFKSTDLIFRDFVYGDELYHTLNGVIYWYFRKKRLDWEFEYRMIDVIDTVELVSRLYEVFIKRDTYFDNTNPTGSDRHRKNFIFKYMRKAVPALLAEQFERHDLVAQEYRNLRNPEKKFRYVSIDRDKGRYIEKLSLKKWEKDISDNRELEIERAILQSIISVLNKTERAVVDLVRENKSYEEISDELMLQQDRIRKILFSAKRKLRKEYQKRADISCDSLLN